MNSIVKGIDQINRWVTWVVVLMLGTMSVVVFLQVFYRYVLSAPLPWSEELSRYLMIWTTFLGAALGIRRKALLGMEAVMNILPKKAKQLMVDAVSVIQIIFLMIVLIYGVKMTVIANNQISPAMLIPMSWAYFGIPVGATLMILNTLSNSFERWGGAK